MSFQSKFFREDEKQNRNGKACQAEPVKLDIKRHYMVFYLLWIIRRFLSIKSIKQRKSIYAVLFKLADVMNVLWRKLVTSLSQ